MSATDTLTQAPATPLRDEEKDRQIDRLLADMTRRQPLWAMTPADVRKQIDRPPRRERSH